MKIEKLSDNQIRCTLTRADLAERQLQLSELAYGTEKARSLFHDMMQQAAQEFGFEAENMPLMIEAIPSSSDSIVLIITKVEDPEELDTRFSKFAPLPGQDGDSSRQGLPDKLEGAESLLDLLGKVKEKINAAQSSSKPENPVSSSSESLDDPETEALENEIPKDAAPKKPAIRLISFASMYNVLAASRLLGNMYFGANTLYKDTAENIYILAMTQSEHTRKDFSRLCNMLSEYGTLEKTSGATIAFLGEHCKVLLENDAVQQLANV